MSDIYPIMTTAIANDVSKLETINHNIANVQTTAFKRQVAELDANREIALYTDMQQGSVAKTNRNLDMAIDGPGFFVIRHQGAEVLSRNGHFMLNKHGQLVNDLGDPLQGQGGDIVLKTDQVKINAVGEVYDGETKVAQVKVVNIKGSSIEPLGNHYYVSNGAAEDVIINERKILQGYLEQSNVKSVNETTALMALKNDVQSKKNALQIYDSVLSTAINDLNR